MTHTKRALFSCCYVYESIDTLVDTVYAFPIKSNIQRSFTNVINNADAIGRLVICIVEYIIECSRCYKFRVGVSIIDQNIWNTVKFKLIKRL